MRAGLGKQSMLGWNPAAGQCSLCPPKAPAGVELQILSPTFSCLFFPPHSFPSSRPQFLSLWNCFSFLICLPCSSGSLGNQGAVIAGLADQLFMVWFGEVSLSAVHSFAQGLHWTSLLKILVKNVLSPCSGLCDLNLSFVALSKDTDVNYRRDSC